MERPTIAINVQGGVVSHVLASEEVNIIIIDHDTQGDGLTDFPGCAGDCVEVVGKNADQVDKGLAQKMWGSL